MAIDPERLDRAMKLELERRLQILAGYDRAVFGEISTPEWLIVAALCLVLPLILVLVSA